MNTSFFTTPFARHRLAELTSRPASVKKCKEKVEKMRALMAKWETTMEQVTEEERGDVFEKIEKVEKWLEEKVRAREERSANVATPNSVTVSNAMNT